MKKITLLIVALFSFTFGFSQFHQINELGENNPVVYIDQAFQRAPCVTAGASNSFENGTSCVDNLGRIVANDIVVVAGEDMVLETITPNVFIGATGSGINAAYVNVYIYDDNAGIPGTLITSENLIPTAQTVVGSNYGFDVWALDIDITDVPLPGDTGSDTVYWIGISVEATDGSNVFWENSSAGIIGNYGQSYDDGTGAGFITDNTFESVYVFTADCTPILGIDDNLLSQVSVYPNPMTDVLNVKVPGNVEIIDARLVTVLGQDTGIKLANGTMNTADLARGIYMLTVKTSAGTLTQKVIKQ